MLLVASGRWHGLLPNEPLAPPGWEEVFRLLAGDVEGEHLHGSDLQKRGLPGLRDGRNG